MTSNYYPPNTDLAFRLTSPEEETRLFLEARAGNGDSREFLIRNHLLFAAMQARKLGKGRLPDADLLSAANLALMKAFDKFDPTHGNRFSSYLRLFIRGEVSALWKQHFKALENMSPQLPEGSTSPHEEREESEHLNHLKGMLADMGHVLNGSERLVLQQHYFHGKSFASIGRSRKVTREAIRLCHSRALEKLRRAFTHTGVPE
jgi:RNA polymerase sigma factor (sigma-70 family)